MAQPKIATSLKGLGFDDVDVEAPRRLIISSAGQNKTGKTNFLLTAPGPIAVFNLDLGLEGMVHKHVTKTHRVLTRTFSLPADTVGLSEDQVGELAMELFNEFSAAFQAACKLPKKEVATIGWDSGTEAWEMARLGFLGKLAQVMPHHYTMVNSEFRKLLRCITDTDKNFVITHKLKREYVDALGPTGKKIQVPSGDWVRSGFGDIGYVVQVNLRHYRDEEGFGMELLDCRQDGELAGMTFKSADCNFAKLATTIFPDTDEKDWR
jgi:hypothetical protein